METQKSTEWLLTTSDLLEALDISDETLRKWRMNFDFPKPIKITSRTLRWRKSNIDEWLDAQKSRNARGLTRIVLLSQTYQGADELVDLEDDMQNLVYLSPELPDEFSGKITVTISYEGDDV